MVYPGGGIGHVILHLCIWLRVTVTEIHRKASNSGHSYGTQLNVIKDKVSHD